MLKYLFLVCLITLSACSKSPETNSKTVVLRPAQFELIWDQAYDVADPQQNSTDISPAIKVQLLKLGPFRSESTITSKSNQSSIQFRVVFSNDISLDQIDEIAPFIKQVLAPANYKMIFHGAQYSKSFRISVAKEK